MTTYHQSRGLDLVAVQPPLSEARVPRQVENEFVAWTFTNKDQISDQVANCFPFARHT